MIFLLYLFYARLTGEIEAFNYSRKGADAIKGDDRSWQAAKLFVLHLFNRKRNRPASNEHLWMVTGRGLAFFFVLGGVAYRDFFSLGTTLLLLAVEAAAVVLAFSFIRDRHYYLMRDVTDSTNHGPRYQSPTDSAEIKFNYVQRRNMFYISVAVLLNCYIIIYLFH